MPRKPFVKCGLIVTKIDMEVAEHDTCMIDKYHSIRSKDKVIEIVKMT